MKERDARGAVPSYGIPDVSGSHEIPSAQYAAIGSVVNIWADFEFEIDMAVWALLNVPHALGACVTAQMISPMPKLKAYQSLVRLFGASEQSIIDLVTFTGSIAPLNERRNRTVHDKRLWSAQYNSVSRFQVTANSKLVFGPVPESIADLIAFSQEISEKIVEFSELHGEISAELNSLPADRRPPLPAMTNIARDLSAAPSEFE